MELYLSRVRLVNWGVRLPHLPSQLMPHAKRYCFFLKKKIRHQSDEYLQSESSSDVSNAILVWKNCGTLILAFVDVYLSARCARGPLPLRAVSPSEHTWCASRPPSHAGSFFLLSVHWDQWFCFQVAWLKREIFHRYWKHNCNVRNGIPSWRKATDIRVSINAKGGGSRRRGKIDEKSTYSSTHNKRDVTHCTGTLSATVYCPYLTFDP